jgi:anthranilate synthase/phosphoribosyltransferase
MILLIDNYDSFTYNLYQYIRQLGFEVAVHRNDALTIDDIRSLAPTHIVISPGPGSPVNAGLSTDIISQFAGTIPLLGVCLGHQCIGAAFGGAIVHASELFHGKESLIYHDNKGVYSGMPNPFRAIRYHSLAIARTSLPAELLVSAWTDDGEIMGVRHRDLAIEGVQFHPESVGTEQGIRLLENFLSPAKPVPPIRHALAKVVNKAVLSIAEAEAAMDEISSGSANQTLMAGLLAAMAVRGEAATEITGFVRVLRRKAAPFRKPAGRPVVDTCGTGGDGAGTFNISTCAAFVAAGAGATVAKHGNRSASSRCGSADVLEALGIQINASAQIMEQALADVGIAFLFAPRYHGSMMHVAPVRSEMGIRTVFNIIGPLANPACPDRQILGVSSPSLLQPMSEALISLGVKHAMVVHGHGGLDELSLTGPSMVCESRDGWTRSFMLDPAELGLPPCSIKDLQGGSLKQNCSIFLSVLDGQKGPCRDIVLLNAAAALYLCDLANDMPMAVALAKDSIDSGRAKSKFAALRVGTHD